MQKSTSVCSSMGEKILARIKREWFHIASINNQGGFDMHRHELLQAQRKRPTRSKSYQAGRVSEHQAFQITLSWLWGRHDLCCSSAEPRLFCVIDDLADCSKCQAGELCEFMDNVRAREQPIGQGGADKVEGIESDDSSLWEGEGTSDSLSSVAPTEPVAVVSKPCRRSRGKQKHLGRRTHTHAHIHM